MKKLYKKKSDINGNGLYIAEPAKKGETIGYIHGPIEIIRHFTPKLAKATLDWIGVGRYSWIDTSDSEYRFINHSCNPNVAIVTKRKVVALRNLKKDEEITMDYSLTEADEGWSINCSCKEKACRGKITAIQNIPKKTYNKHKSHIPQNFKKIYEVAQKA